MPPNPKCIVCSSKPEAFIKIDTTRVTVKQFRDDVLVKALNMIDPDVILDGKGVIVISSEEGETECNNDKLLSDMDIVDGCILKCDDFFQNYELSIIIVHKEMERDGDLFEVIADRDTLKANDTPKEELATVVKNGEPQAKKARRELKDESDDDLLLIEEDDDDDVEAVDGPSTSIASPINSQNGNGSEATSKPIVVDEVDEICVIADDDDDDDDDIAVVVDKNEPSTSSDRNRKITPKKRRVNEDGGEPSSKRSRVIEIDDDEVVLIDDD